MAVNWTTLENAIAAWVRGASGLQAIWVRQNQPQPSLPYLTMKRSPARDAAQGMMLDPVVTKYDNTQPSGSEIIVTLTGEREFTCTIEAFSNSVTASGTAAEYLEDCLTALQLPTYSQNLWIAGLSLRERGNVLDLSELVATAFQTRAQMDVRFGIRDVQTDTPTGYIATVDLNTTIDGIEYDYVLGLS